MSATSYWNQGEANAPWITGAAAVMDCADLRDACAGLGVTLPLPGVLDVGCGTGRFAQCCAAYVGVDIARDQVAYARARGLDAHVIAGPAGLPAGPFDWVTCFSVFTHIGRRGRRAYLEAFAERAENLMVDIIPGDGTGDVALWTADPTAFLEDLVGAGWDLVAGPYDRTSPDGVTHRYLWAVYQ